MGLRAAQMLLYVEEMEKAENRRLDVKRSLIATGNFDYEKMLPEFFSHTAESEEEESAAEAAGDAVSYDYSGVKWMTPKDNKESYEKLLDHMLKQGGGTMTGEDVVVTETEWV